MTADVPTGDTSPTRASPRIEFHRDAPTIGDIAHISQARTHD